MLPLIRWAIVDPSLQESPGKICTGITMPGCSKRNEFGINSFFVTEDKISTGVYNLMNNSRNY